MSRTYRRSPSDPEYEFKRPQRRGQEQPFRCRHCKTMVGLVPFGGKHRNHCPYCLYSRHVDGRVPGDRASTCGGSMAPVGAFVRRNGEHAIVHRCLTCRFDRYNRIAADDDFDLVLSLPVLPAQPAHVAGKPAAHELTA